jgi:phage FluMu protein Com
MSSLARGAATMIDVKCPLCEVVYHADPVHLGKLIRCTKCGSLLPILGSGGTLAQKPPDARGIQHSRSGVEPKAARPRPHRTAFRVGFAIVAIIAVGLANLWRLSKTHEDTNPVRTRARESQTSSQQAEGTTQEPAVNPDALPVLGGEGGIGSDGLPCGEQSPTRRRSIPNGSRIMPDVGTNGYGELEVQNGTSEDAVLSLYDSASDETVRDIYVQARHSVRMKGIPGGTYQLAYTAGRDWDGREAIFRCEPHYAQFEQDFAFTEERNQEGIQYHSITVTLHPVIGGNVRTKRISREEFLKGHRRASLTR